MGSVKSPPLIMAKDVEAIKKTAFEDGATCERLAISRELERRRARLPVPVTNETEFARGCQLDELVEWLKGRSG